MNQMKTAHKTPAGRTAYTAVCAVVGMIAAGAMAPADATPVFPESNFQLVYDLSIPNSVSYLNTAVPYAVNNAARVADGSFSRVGYLLQLQTAGGALETVSVSMDAFTTKASLLGVPTVASGEIYNDVAVSNMNVISNVAGVANGTALSTGYIQFWPDCYGYKASSYSTGNDVINAGSQCYGSMQIGNGIGNTVLAYNAWNTGRTSDLGIGNDPNGSNSDWTFAYNASSYSVKDLSIWVETAVPEPMSAALVLAGLAGLALVRRHRRARPNQADRPNDGLC